MSCHSRSLLSGNPVSFKLSIQNLDTPVKPEYDGLVPVTEGLLIFKLNRIKSFFAARGDKRIFWTEAFLN